MSKTPSLLISPIAGGAINPSCEFGIRGIALERSSFCKSLKSQIHRLPLIVSPPVPKIICLFESPLRSHIKGDIYVSLESGTTAVFIASPVIPLIIIIWPGGRFNSLSSNE